MLKILLRGSFVALFSVVACGIHAPLASAADEGKALVYLQPPAAPAVAGPCDRQCLYAITDKFFDALASRYTNNVPLAPNFRYTENGQLVNPGEGIWKTFARRGTYRVYLADPANGLVGYYGDYAEFDGSLLGVVAMRLKIQDHRITEAELILVREQRRPKGGLGANTAGIMTPHMFNELDPTGFVSPDSALLQPLRATQNRDALTAATNQYFEGFTRNSGSTVPFDAHCSRRENGMPTTNNADGPVLDPAQPAFRVFSQGCAQELDRGFFSALSKVRSARPLVVDEQQGLVLNLALLDNAGNIKTVSVSGVGSIVVPRDFLRPITFLTPQLFKIEEGKIRQIEGLSWPVPFGMSSGWDK